MPSIMLLDWTLRCKSRKANDLRVHDWWVVRELVAWPLFPHLFRSFMYIVRMALIQCKTKDSERLILREISLTNRSLLDRFL